MKTAIRLIPFFLLVLFVRSSSMGRLFERLLNPSVLSTAVAASSLRVLPPISDGNTSQLDRKTRELYGELGIEESELDGIMFLPMPEEKEQSGGSIFRIKGLCSPLDNRIFLPKRIQNKIASCDSVRSCDITLEEKKTLLHELAHIQHRDGTRPEQLGLPSCGGTLVCKDFKLSSAATVPTVVPTHIRLSKRDRALDLLRAQELSADLAAVNRLSEQDRNELAHRCIKRSLEQRSAVALNQLHGYPTYQSNIHPTPEELVVALFHFDDLEKDPNSFVHQTVEEEYCILLNRNMQCSKLFSADCVVHSFPLSEFQIYAEWYVQRLRYVNEAIDEVGWAGMRELSSPAMFKKESLRIMDRAMELEEEASGC